MGLRFGVVLGSIWKIWWGVPKIRGTISEAPVIRIIVFWGLYWGPPRLYGIYHSNVGLAVLDAGPRSSSTEGLPRYVSRLEASSGLRILMAHKSFGGCQN